MALFEKSCLRVKTLVGGLLRTPPLDSKKELDCRAENILGTELNPRMMMQFFLGMTVLLAVVACYWPVLRHLVRVIGQDEDFWFAFLLPAVGIYIVYRQRDQLRRLSWRPSWLGLGIIGFGFGMYVIGDILMSLFIPSLSFIVVLAGLLYLVGGQSLVRSLWFPLFLLILAIPYGGLGYTSITLSLQLISSWLAAGIMRLLGFPVLLTGNIIDLGTQQLNVVAACSGLRYLVNLLIMGVIFCYFFQRRLWKVAILLLSLVPYAILGNGLRLATIGIFPIFKDGLWHSSLGLSIFLVGFDYLKLINWTVNYLVPEGPKPTLEKAPSEPIGLTVKSKSRLSPYLAAALGVVLLGGYLVHSVPQAIAMPPIQSLEKFPLQLGSWQGKRQFIVDDKIIQKLASDSDIEIDYVNPTLSQVSLLIVHYNYLGRGKFLHPPPSCFTGAGGIIEASGVLTPYPDYSLNYMVVKDKGRTFLVYYWFLNRGRWVAKDTTSKLSNLHDALVTRRTDGSLVRLVTPMGDDSAEAHSRLLFFTEFLKGELPKFIRH